MYHYNLDLVNWLCHEQAMTIINFGDNCIFAAVFLHLVLINNFP